MRLDEATIAALHMVAEKGVVLGPLRDSQAAVEEGAWVLEYDVTDEPARFSWYFLLRASRENEIMVCVPAFPAPGRKSGG
jgi:hypothetical protein